MDFEDDKHYQPSLFFNSNPKHKVLMEKIDAINHKYRKDVIRLGSQDFNRHKIRQGASFRDHHYQNTGYYCRRNIIYSEKHG